MGALWHVVFFFCVMHLHFKDDCNIYLLLYVMFTAICACIVIVIQGRLSVCLRLILLDESQKMERNYRFHFQRLPAVTRRKDANATRSRCWCSGTLVESNLKPATAECGNDQRESDSQDKTGWKLDWWGDDHVGVHPLRPVQLKQVWTNPTREESFRGWVFKEILYQYFLLSMNIIWYLIRSLLTWKCSSK